MARIRQISAQRRERPSTALTLCGVVLGAATFGFMAAGVWYQFCLAQGEPEAAAAFADLAPPPAAILLASLGLVTTVGAQLETLRERARADQSSRQPQSDSDAKPDVPSPVLPFVGVSDEPARGSSPHSPIATSWTATSTKTAR